MDQESNHLGSRLKRKDLPKETGRIGCIRGAFSLLAADFTKCYFIETRTCGAQYVIHGSPMFLYGGFLK